MDYMRESMEQGDRLITQRERWDRLLKEMEELVRGAAADSERESATPRDCVTAQMKELSLVMPMKAMIMQERQSAERRIPDVPLMRLREEGDVVEFLHVAELMIDYCEVQPEQWAAIVAPYLTGKAQQAYRALGDKERDDYGAVKHAIFHRYGITNGIYRCLFIEAVKRKAAQDALWEALWVAVEKQAVALVAAAKQAAADEAAEKQAAMAAAGQAAAEEAAERGARVAKEPAANDVKATAATAHSAAEEATSASDAEAARTNGAIRETAATEIVAASKAAATNNVAAANEAVAANEVAAAAANDTATTKEAVAATETKEQMLLAGATIGAGPTVKTIAEVVLATGAAASEAARLNAKPCHWVIKRPALAHRRQPAVT